MEINKGSLLPSLIYNKPIQYSSHIVLYPVKMNDIIEFQTLIPSITLRKNSIFHDKQLIKMDYIDFLLYSCNNIELEKQYGLPGLSNYYVYALRLLQLCCNGAELQIRQQDNQILINGESITPKKFDDLRRIIIIQNDVDFDMDEFLNYDTEKRLLEAQKGLNKDNLHADIEDYIDSLVIAMKTTEEQVMNMTIRKFWRYIKRYQLQEGYAIEKAGEYSGMVTFKEPIKYWMTSLDKDDKYEHLKIDENELKGKIG